MTLSQAQIAAATVELPERDGRGVLIPGGYIVTAAHCIREGISFTELALREKHQHRIRIASGVEQQAELVCVEPRADIAVLIPVELLRRRERYAGHKR